MWCAPTTNISLFFPRPNHFRVLCTPPTAPTCLHNPPSPLTRRSANWRSGGPAAALPCSQLGLIVVSNRFVLPADGISFGSPGQSMLGQAYLSTRLGATSAAGVASSSGRSNSWLLVLDAANFAGPVAYASPDFWLKDNGVLGYGLIVSVEERLEPSSLWVQWRGRSHDLREHGGEV